MYGKPNVFFLGAFNQIKYNSKTGQNQKDVKKREKNLTKEFEWIYYVTRPDACLRTDLTEDELNLLNKLKEEAFKNLVERFKEAEAEELINTSFFEDVLKETPEYKRFISALEEINYNSKFSGLWNKDGPILKENLDRVKDKMAQIKDEQLIFEQVISLDSFFQEESHVNTPASFYEIIKANMPKILENYGFDAKAREKIEWNVGFHVNTDNFHAHMSFYEVEPTFKNGRGQKQFKRKGAPPLEKLIDNAFILDNAISHDKVVKNNIYKFRQEIEGLFKLKVENQDKYYENWINKLSTKNKKTIMLWEKKDYKHYTNIFHKDSFEEYRFDKEPYEKKELKWQKYLQKISIERGDNPELLKRYLEFSSKEKPNLSKWKLNQDIFAYAQNELNVIGEEILRVQRSLKRYKKFQYNSSDLPSHIKKQINRVISNAIYQNEVLNDIMNIFKLNIESQRINLIEQIKPYYKDKYPGLFLTKDKLGQKKLLKEYKIEKNSELNMAINFDYDQLYGPDGLYSRIGNQIITFCQSERKVVDLEDNISTNYDKRKNKKNNKKI